MLTSLTSKGYLVKDSLAFAKDIVEQDSEFFMGSLDVDSLSTNIPLGGLLISPLIHLLKIRKEYMESLLVHLYV